mgnify:CR=1 FL=1
MVVLVGEVQLHLPESQSLKDKRQVVKSLKDRVRNRFNVSIAEVDYVDLWQRCAIGIAVVSTTREHAEETLSTAVHFIEADGRAQLLEFTSEVV